MTNAYSSEGVVVVLLLLICTWCVGVWARVTVDCVDGLWVGGGEVYAGAGAFEVSEGELASVGPLGALVCATLCRPSDRCCLVPDDDG